MFIAISHVDMTYTTGCRDKKVFAMNHLGPWGPLRFTTGLYWVSADLLGLPDAEYFIGWDLAPHHQHQGPKNVDNLHLGPLGN